jgi:putative nucleotidyltransferase with HDIG domain
MLLASLARKAAVVIRNGKLYNELNALFLNTIKTLVFVIEGKDAYTRGHSERVSLFSVLLAKRLGLSADQREALNWSALLHDIGKIKIPEAILQKQGKLTADEWTVIKNHPVYGAQILQPIEQLGESLSDIRHHHERIDGGGYPDGLGAEHIPLGARIIAVADTFDALTSDRCYRPRFDGSQALDILRENAGSQLDTDVVAVLLNAPEELQRYCQTQPGDDRTAERTVVGVDA